MMLACIWLPHFAIRVLAHRQFTLDQPLALASAHEAHPVVLDCSESARTSGVEPGMLISRALGCCGDLQVLECDTARVENAAEQFIRRLESMGAAVEPEQPGRALFDVRPLIRLHGGVDGVLEQVRRAFRSPEVRIGVAANPFVSWVAARHAPAGGHLLVARGDEQQLLADMPLAVLPASRHFLELVSALGLHTLGDFAALRRSDVTDRFGEAGALLHQLAGGADPRQLAPRHPVDPVEESFSFPEAVANLHTLQSAVHMLLERALAHPRCAQHAPRAVVVVAQLVSGGSHQVRRVLRTPTVELSRVALAAQVAVEGVAAPVERLTVRLEQFAARLAVQSSLLDERAAARDGCIPAREDDSALQAGVRHVQGSLGEGALLQVLEVEPWSRVPERHAVLVPRIPTAEQSVPAFTGSWV